MPNDGGKDSTFSPDGSTSKAIERRKAQNRASQQKYRARQKFKMEVAKAILQEGKHPDLLRFWDSKSKAGKSIDDAIQLLGDVPGDDPKAKDNGSVEGASDSPSEDPTPGSSLRGEQASSRNSSPAPLESISAEEENRCIIAIPNDQHELSSFQPLDNSPLSLSCANSPLEEFLARDMAFVYPNATSQGTRVSTPLHTASFSPAGMRIEKDPTLTYTTLAGPSPASSQHETSYSQIPSGTPTHVAVTPLDTLNPPMHADSPISRTTLGSKYNHSLSTPKSVDLTSPLLTAVSIGNLEIASLLMQHGAQLDPSALDRSIEKGDSVMACNLLDLGASLFTKDASGAHTTHVHKAVEINDDDMVRALLQWCVRKDKGRDAEERRGNLDSLLQIVLNQARSNGMTLIHQAVYLQHSSIVETLLEFGADVNIRFDS